MERGRNFENKGRGLNGQDGVDNEVTSQVGVQSGVIGQFGNSTAEDGQLGNGNGEAGQNSIGIAASNSAAVIRITAVNVAAAVGSSNVSALVGVAAANAASSIGVAAATVAINSSGSSSGTVTFFPSWLLAPMIGISILLSVSRETYVQLGRSLLWRIVWSYLPSFSPWSTPSPPSTSQLFLAIVVGFHSYVAQTAVLLVSMLPSGLSSMGMMSFLLKFLLSFGITSIPAIIVHKVFLRLFLSELCFTFPVVSVDMEY
ncbi:uncharacterized protein LOC112167225 [Rosa chinensis]|uniref:uncharacterized protein LOC112167225 n=1 Tax=Rosa chinensis TaxID=74649 RepID=UPI000D097838|nr:uncharacterized protein LOC112167225 [Rosa chinensis]